MNISPGLIAKGAAGTLATTTAIGGGGIVANKFGLFGDLFGKNVEATVATEGEPDITEVIASRDPAKSITDIGNGDRGLSHEPGSTVDTSHLSVTEPTRGPMENGVGTTITSDDSESSQKQVQDSEEDGDKEGKLTKFDKGLIKWLKTDGNDIVFSIKEGNKNDEITEFTSLSADETEIKISVEVKDDSKNLKGGGDKTPLKKLNEDKNWTWICEMKFKKDEGSSSVNSINSEHKNRVYGDQANDEKGLFKKLMKDVSSDGNLKNLKEIKRNFIKKCARAREETEREGIENGVASDGREIKTPKERIVFILAKGESGKDWGNNEGELYFKEKDKLNEWFLKKNS